MLHRPVELAAVTGHLILGVRQPDLAGPDGKLTFAGIAYTAEMGEFLLELLLAFGELFLEVLFEFAGETVLDLALRAVAKVFTMPRFTSPVLASASYTCLGVLAGGLSLIVFPHPLVRPSRLHGISLLVSPIQKVPVSKFFDGTSKKKFQVQTTDAILMIDSAENEYEADVYFWANNKFQQEPVDY